MAQQGQAPGGRPAGAPAAVPMPFAVVQDINKLSELSGIPVHALSNPAMQLAAQQLVAQRQLMMQQQLMASGGQVRPGAVPMLPAQMLALQQAQQVALQQRLAAAGAAGGAAAAQPAKKGGGGRRRGGGRAAAAAAPSAAAMFAAAAAQPARNAANPYADPGGNVVWAKVGSYPWWPAKTLDPQRDQSYPPDADPPRPTSIPIRFFGTYEFQWIGSKRALTDWEEGLEQFREESDQAGFKRAIQEAEAYRAGGKLPGVFYVTPEPTQPKAKARGKKRGAAARTAVAAVHDPAELMAAAAAAAAPAGAKAARAAGRAAEPAEDRAVVVQRRKKQRLQDLGLLPPDNSPYTRGRVAPNPHLLAKADEWGQQYAGVVTEHRQQQVAIAAARAEEAAAKARAAEAAKAAAAAAAAAAAPATAHGMFAAAMQGAGQPSAAVLQQQMMLQQMMLQQMQQAQTAAALPRV